MRHRSRPDSSLTHRIGRKPGACGVVGSVIRCLCQRRVCRIACGQQYLPCLFQGPWRLHSMLCFVALSFIVPLRGFATANAFAIVEVALDLFQLGCASWSGAHGALRAPGCVFTHGDGDQSSRMQLVACTLCSCLRLSSHLLGCHVGAFVLASSALFKPFAPCRLDHVHRSASVVTKVLLVTLGTRSCVSSFQPCGQHWPCDLAWRPCPRLVVNMLRPRRLGLVCLLAGSARFGLCVRSLPGISALC